MDYDKSSDKIYTVESITDPEHLNLFEVITECGEHNWKEKLGKKVIDLEYPAYPQYRRLDFIHLIGFLLKLVGTDKKRQKKFKTAINNSAIQWEAFYRGQYRNVSSNIVQIGICIAAKFLKIPLISLLAKFLEHCEASSIRLHCHDEYEEIIESFLREAPDLVEQLQSKPLQPFTQGNEKQSPSQTIAKNRHNIERVEGKEKWLDPYNFDELPLVGREKERKLLDKFIEIDDQFKIWAIAGPSGSGKTRLACEWAYNSDVLTNWDCRVLHKEDRIELEKWSSWIPDRPTLIIIDYLYGFEKVVLKLMGRRLNPTEHKIRLLLIDHIFSEPLHTDKRWGFSADGSSLNRNEKYFFDLKPLDLIETNDQKEIIKSIIIHRASLEIQNQQVEEAHDYLSNIQGAYHPLFAALVGDAIKSGTNFKTWNRRELIYYYLSEERLPWKHGSDEGRWASYFIAVATARYGVTYKDLVKAASNCEFRPKHFVDVKEICQKVITDDNATALAPFEPDILGESFFLKFLQYLEDAPDYQHEFRQILMAGDEVTQTEDAIEFIAFIQRLTRNLLNDDQSQNETRVLWDTLFDFMRPSEFGNALSIKWALIAGIIDIVDAIQDKFPEEKLIAFLNQAHPAVLYREHDSSHPWNPVLNSMRSFELTSKLAKINPEFSEEEMPALLDRDEAIMFINGGTPLMIASCHGFNAIINALIDRGANIEATLPGLVGGQNALMFACIEGQTEAVKKLLNAGANLHVTDNGRHTALIYACYKGHIEVVKLLLDRGADIHAVDGLGRTALDWACSNGHLGIVSLLLKRKARTNVVDSNG